MQLTKQTNRFVLFSFCIFAFLPMLLFAVIPNEDTLGMPVLYALIQMPTMLLPIILFFVITKADWRETLRFRPLGWKNVCIIVLLGFAIQPLMGLFSYVTSLFFPNAAAESFAQMEDSGFLFAFLSVAILPAFLEEITFRGIVLSGYKHVAPWKALLISSLVFGLFHMNLQQIPYAFLAGLVFAFLVQRTGSLWASILPHFLVNGFNTVVAFLVTASGMTAPTETVSYTADLMIVGLNALFSLPFLGLLLYAFLKLNPMNKGEGSSPKESIFTPSLVVFFVLAFLLGVLPSLIYLVI